MMAGECSALTALATVCSFLSVQLLGLSTFPALAPGQMALACCYFRVELRGSGRFCIPPSEASDLCRNQEVKENFVRL